MNTATAQDSADRVRVDKWLWAARFFKHRSGASEACEGGKVHVNGHSVKPARPVKVGDIIDVTVGEQQFTVLVRGLADKRGPASVAQTLYAETPESVARREAARQQQRMAPAPGHDLSGRPTKRDRRRIERMRFG
jgi:ribosome-associated heat shock protein Hsp15